MPAPEQNRGDGVHHRDRKASTPPSKSAEVPTRKNESSWQSLVVAARDSGQQNVVVLEDELHWKLDSGLESRPDSETQCVK
jgi:hypothetical protein